MGDQSTLQELRSQLGQLEEQLERCELLPPRSALREALLADARSLYERISKRTLDGADDGLPPDLMFADLSALMKRTLSAANLLERQIKMQLIFESSNLKDLW